MHVSEFEVRGYKSAVTVTAKRAVKGIFRRLGSVYLMVILKTRNRLSKKSVIGSSDIVVSLTSYGRRLSTAFYAIESIGCGRTLPSRIILWIDDPSILSDKPESLKRLERRGLEIRLTSNYGPHTKYFPYVVGIAEGHRTPLVTADDDLLYPRNWLQALAVSAAQHSDRTIVCHRAKVVKSENGVLRPYLEWEDCRSSIPSVTNFATGVSGVLYPPSFLDRLAEYGDDFIELCPRADDVWLHRVALREGYEIAQIGNVSRLYPFVLGTQSSGLVLANGFGGENDLQINRTYSKDDIYRLECACNAHK